MNSRIPDLQDFKMGIDIAHYGLIRLTPVLPPHVVGAQLCLLFFKWVLHIMV